jgi:hypothetical protein
VPATLPPAVARDPDPEDAISLIEAYQDRGWTDGLPVVPPSERAIAAALAATGLAASAIVGEIPGRNTAVTAEKLAINAVMAGCRPEYTPVVTAAVRARSRLAYHGPASSTGLGHDPHRQRPIAAPGLNTGNNAFGQAGGPTRPSGARAWSAMNAMNTRPGFPIATLGNPGKYASASRRTRRPPVGPVPRPARSPPGAER